MPAVRADPGLPLVWPPADADAGIAVREVSLASATPFTLDDAGDPRDAPPAELRATLFLPQEASAANPVPAVVFLHGAAGVLSSRGPAYARQLAQMGVAGVVVDSFGSRRELGTSFIDRLLNITEAAILADAYATLAWLDGLPEVDGERVALMGFSYGGMATLYGVQEQVARTFLPQGPRFAGHVAFYAPCIASFEETATTGAPVLMLAGDGDAIVDPQRCAETEAALEAGGSTVTRITYEGAYHQWDGNRAGPRPIGRNLAPCRFVVEADGDVVDGRSGLPMTGPFLRKIILGLCSDSDGYLIGRDDAVRARAVADVARFLNGVFEGS
ncbi:MAG: dienelactone hydrolase family protein [Proteobacteria bacterium]|nr:dienelactone hydrolase family protein [Pseudomonadota bacterium]